MIKQQIKQVTTETDDCEEQGTKSQEQLFEQYSKSTDIYKMQKEKNKSLKQVIQTEEFNIR